MKEVAKKWAEEVIKNHIEDFEQDFIHYIIYGRTKYLDTQTVDDIISYGNVSAAEVIEKYKQTLTIEEQEQLFSNKPI